MPLCLLFQVISLLTISTYLRYMLNPTSHAMLEQQRLDGWRPGYFLCKAFGEAGRDEVTNYCLFGNGGLRSIP